MAQMAHDASPLGQHVASVASSFYERGYCVLPQVLAPHHVAAMLADVRDDLATQSNAESGCGARIALGDALTWPRGRARRVAECAPVGEASYWDALREHAPLRAALDAIMGAEAWHLPLNAGDAEGRVVGPRHWYAPVVFPEHPPIESERSPVEPGAPAGAAACPGPRRALFASCQDEQLLNGPCTNAAAHARWQPVSRRRFCNKGWHLDIGPGFPGDGARDLRTHDAAQDQGAVLLLLLTDWAPGGGGTAMIPYSQHWVARELAATAAAGEPPLSHEQLNTHFVTRLRHATETQGRVVLACSCDEEPAHQHARLEGGSARLEVSADGDLAGHARLPNDIDGNAPIVVEQVIGCAGDLVVMHPLLLHSGTTNMRDAPRVMVNGMARVLPEAFNAGGAGNYVARRSHEALERMLELHGARR